MTERPFLQSRSSVVARFVSENVGMADAFVVTPAKVAPIVRLLQGGCFERREFPSAYLFAAL